MRNQNIQKINKKLQYIKSQSENLHSILIQDETLIHAIKIQQENHEKILREQIDPDIQQAKKNHSSSLRQCCLISLLIVLAIVSALFYKIYNKK